MFGSLQGDDDDIVLPSHVEESEGETLPTIPSLNYTETPFSIHHFNPEPRCLSCISTDKMTYKPGETLYCRIITLDAFNHTPITSNAGSFGTFHVKILNSKDENVFETGVKFVNSTLSFKWSIPATISGGTYKIDFFTQSGSGCVDSSRTFDILKYTPPIFKKELTFVKKAYSAGQVVKCILQVKRSEGSFCDCDTTQIGVIARVDGIEIFREDGSTGKFKLGLTDRDKKDRDKCIVSFQLPEVISGVGIGTLSCVVTEGVTETISKSIPIVLWKMDCRVFPEGGLDYFVGGVRNGCYVQAWTSTMDPADFEAVLVERNADMEEGEGEEEREEERERDDETEERIIMRGIRTCHEGRAFFEFVPSGVKKKYSLRIVKPPGIVELVDLPRVKSEGVALRCVDRRALEYGKAVSVLLESPTEGRFHVAAFKREKQLVGLTVELTGSQSEKVDLRLPLGTDGVVRVTVFDTTNKPVAERIVFVAPKHKLSFEFESDKEIYAPGDQVKLKIVAKRGEEVVDASVGVTVTNDSVRKLTEKRRRAPRLPAMFFFENEVEELCDAMAYFEEDEDDPENVPPEIKVDLLLGTQGWRRFLYRNPEESVSLGYSGKIKRLFAIQYGEPPPPLPPMGFFADMRFNAMPLAVGCAAAIPCAAAMPTPAPLFAAPPIPVKAPMPAPAPMPVPAQAPPAPPAVQAAQAPRNRPARPPPAIRGPIALGGRRGGAMGAMGLFAPPPPPREPPLEYFREYAHPVNPNRVDGQRVDFAETLFYAACLETKKDNPASVTFALNDDVTSFMVVLDGWSTTGAIGGSQTFIIKSVKPFFVTPKIPLELSFGDIVQLPVGLVNNLKKRQNVSMSLEGSEAFEVAHPEASVELSDLERKAHYYSFKVKNTETQDQTLKLAATTDCGLSDEVHKGITVLPFGFPMYHNFSDRLSPNETKTYRFTMPDSVIPGSMKTLAYCYPSPVGNLMKGLEGLIRSPGGCFEQTSMTMYPMIMAIQFFETHDGADEALMEKANQHLETGYKRLVGYECPNHGFEWFGGDPGHEALTSMGLMEFCDLSSIFPVDTEMVARTKEWLMSRMKEDRTGFERNSKALDNFGRAPENTTDAYIAFALSRAGSSYEDLEEMISKLERESTSVWKEDGYFVALVACCLFTVGQQERSLNLLATLKELQDESGMVTQKKASITNSSGGNLDVEATSVAVLAFCNSAEYFDQAEKGVAYLHTQCQGGRYGSTQATVLALQAIIRWDQVSAVAQAEGALELKVNDAEELGVGIAEGMDQAIVLPEFGNLLVAGQENVLSITMHEACKMPFSIQVAAFTTEPLSHGTEKLSFANRLVGSGTLPEGDATEIAVDLENVTSEGLPMTCIIIAVPSGLRVRFDKLKELKRAGVVDSFELFGSREVVFYFRQMAPEERKNFTFDVIAEIPGIYQAKSSRAFLYYGDEDQVLYTPGLAVTILPKES